MARISLQCTCGWSFFVSEATLGWQVACPSCGAAVPIPGRRPGKVYKSHAEVAREKAGRTRSLIFLGVGALALAGIAALLLTLGREEDTSSRDGRKPGGRSPSDSAKSSGQASAPVKILDPAAPVSPAPGSAGYAETVPALRRNVDLMVTYTNMAGIVSEVLRHQGRAEAYERLRNRMLDYEDRIQKSLARLLDRGDQYPVPVHMAYQDRMNVFAEREIFKMTPRDAAAHIDKWLRAFQPGAMTQAEVLRGADVIRITFFFPEQNDELLLLMKEAAIVPGEVPYTPPVAAPASPPSAEVLAVPESILRTLREKLDALPSGYRQCMPPEERERMDRLIRAPEKVFREDVGFLKERILGQVLPIFEAEQQQFREKMRELEEKIKEMGSTDVVVFKAGHRLEGKVEEETEEYVKIKTRVGSAKVPRGDIQKIDRGKGATSEFPDRLKSAQGKPDQLNFLMIWCKEKNLPLHKEYLCNLILSLDPQNERARNEIHVGRPFTQASAAGGQPPQDNEAVSRRIEAIAADVVARATTFHDVTAEMKKQTERLRYSAVVQPPDKFAQVVGIIQDPIQFKPGDLRIDSAAQIGQWWSGLAPEERRQFAHFFGVWCAYIRFVTEPRK